MPRRILLINDVLFRQSLHFHLEQAGYEAETVTSAEDGLNFAS